MTEKIKKLFAKYRELILYVICGALTTAADYVSYAVFTRLLSMDKAPAQVLACIVAIIVAFALNKWIVFNNDSAGGGLVAQLVSFASMRLVSSAFQVGALWLFAERLGLYDMAVKLVTSVVVVASNYIFSKLIIFKNKEVDKK